MATEWQYFCTSNAYDPASLTRHMNQMAGAGWELLTVTFAIKGEGGTHNLFWRRPVPRAAAGPSAAGP